MWKSLIRDAFDGETWAEVRLGWTRLRIRIKKCRHREWTTFMKSGCGREGREWVCSREDRRSGRRTITWEET